LFLVEMQEEKVDCVAFKVHTDFVEEGRLKLFAGNLSFGVDVKSSESINSIKLWRLPNETLSKLFYLHLLLRNNS